MPGSCPRKDGGRGATDRERGFATSARTRHFKLRCSIDDLAIRPPRSRAAKNASLPVQYCAMPIADNCGDNGPWIWGCVLHASTAAQRSTNKKCCVVRCKGGPQLAAELAALSSARGSRFRLLGFRFSVFDPRFSILVFRFAILGFPFFNTFLIRP